MGQPGSLTPPAADQVRAVDHAWSIVLDAASRASGLAVDNLPAAFTIAETSGDDERPLVPTSLSDPDAALRWQPTSGWELLLPAGDLRHPHIDLYLPICSATPDRPITVGHLGQSLDGFIATHSGDSQFVTGQANIRHLHRMRALCDAIIVGAGTVAADNPQLTTRHVAGTNPIRVVLDPSRRLGDHYKVFSDDAVETIYVCRRDAVLEGETEFGRATILPVDERHDGIDVSAVLPLLRERGCHRIFVEGGGVTVSMFLEARLLDRLQVAIAPLIIGDGRPAVRLPPPDTLSECTRPRYRVFRMGGDMFFDCDLRPANDDAADGGSTVSRVI